MPSERGVVSDTRAAVLSALRASYCEGVSGEALAHELGVSRAAVGKHVASLRALGYVVDALPGSGYRLVSAPDLPTPDELAPLLEGGFWKPIGGGETGSTNDDAKSLARDGAEEGTVVLAARQTVGRGRLGRRWASPEGGLYLSAVFRPPLPPVEISPLALVVGLGTAWGLEGLGAEVALKWPNDLLARDGRKLAGVLLEISADTDLVEWVVAGVGLNIRPPAEDRPERAVYLAELLPATPRLAEVAASVLGGIESAYRAYLVAGYAALQVHYDERLALIGRDVTVRDAAGRVLSSGVVAGTDASGRLLLQAGDERSAVAAGEVTLREPPHEA